MYQNYSTYIKNKNISRESFLSKCIKILQKTFNELSYKNLLGLIIQHENTIKIHLII